MSSNETVTYSIRMNRRCVNSPCGKYETTAAQATVMERAYKANYSVDTYNYSVHIGEIPSFKAAEQLLKGTELKFALGEHPCHVLVTEITRKILNVENEHKGQRFNEACPSCDGKPVAR